MSTSWHKVKRNTVLSRDALSTDLLHWGDILSSCTSLTHVYDIVLNPFTKALLISAEHPTATGRRDVRTLLPAMVEVRREKHGQADGRDIVANDDKKKKIALAGVVIAAAAAAVAVGRHLLQEQKFKRMPVYVLKADNGTEAHIRPLGCCIQRMPLSCRSAASASAVYMMSVCYIAQGYSCPTPRVR